DPRPRARASRFLPRVRLRRPRLHDGADRRQAVRRVADRRRAARDLRPLHARALRRRRSGATRERGLQHRMSILATHTIGFIGAGNMAEAMIRGLVRGGHIVASRIAASGPRKERLDQLRTAYAIDVTTDNREVAKRSGLVVLSIKPQIMDKVLREIAEHLT